MQNLIELIEGIQALPDPVEQEPNFFTIGGSGYLENPTSDLLAIFMGGLEGSTPTWLAKALVHCLLDRGTILLDALADYEWDDLHVEREVSINDEQTDSCKRLDLLVSGSAFVLGIEHKVYASATHNPFEVYNQLLQNRAEDRPVLKCVLRPTSYADDVHPDWPVVSYDDLLDKAKQSYGVDVAFAQVSKWQFFYTEFLQHLHALAHPESDNPMDQQTFDFVMQNFVDLRKGRNLLDEFEKQLQHVGKAVVSKALQELGKEANIKTYTHTWPESRALRFRPDCWGQDSDVVLAYYEDDAVDQPVGFFIRAYIRNGSQKADFETIRRELNRVTHEKLDLWEEDEITDGEHCWYEQGEKYLCFGAYGTDRSLDGTLKALASLTKWLHRNAFIAEKVI